jgi:hypothetical protein
MEARGPHIGEPPIFRATPSVCRFAVDTQDRTRRSLVLLSARPRTPADGRVLTDNGKPIERWGRKGTGLPSCERARASLPMKASTVADLPKFEAHTRRPSGPRSPHRTSSRCGGREPLRRAHSCPRNARHAPTLPRLASRRGPAAHHLEEISPLLDHPCKEPRPTRSNPVHGLPGTPGSQCEWGWARSRKSACRSSGEGGPPGEHTTRLTDTRPLGTQALGKGHRTCS